MPTWDEIKDGKLPRRPEDEPLYYHRTATDEPPLGTPCAVIHQFANLPGGSVTEEAIWIGNFWMRLPDHRQFDRSHYQLWRHLT